MKRTILGILCFIAAVAILIIHFGGRGYFSTEIADRPYHSLDMERPQECSAEPGTQNTKMYVNLVGWKTYSHHTENPKNDVDASFNKAWMEYSEKGVLFDERQKDFAARCISKVAASGNPVLVLVFVHGWHHNADNSTDDIRKDAVKFDNLAARFVDASRRLFASRNDRRRPSVVAIYVGWRGERLHSNDPISNYVDSVWGTFKDRAVAADTIGLGPNVDAVPKGTHGLRADLLSLAETLRRVSSDASSRMVAIGHSFGGRVLTRAFIGDFETNPLPLGPNTLMVTINPAVGAECYRGIFERKMPSEALPTWINITSEDDQATRDVYEWAADLHNGAPKCREGDAAGDKTIGQYGPFITHTLRVGVLLNGDSHNLADITAEVARLNARSTAQISDGERDPPLETNWYSGISRYQLITFHEQPVGTNDKHQMSAYTLCLGGKNDCSGDAQGEGGKLWNVRTDRRAIEYESASGYADGTHNGFVSTVLVRLIVERLFAK